MTIVGVLFRLKSTRRDDYIDHLDDRMRNLGIDISFVGSRDVLPSRFL